MAPLILSIKGRGKLGSIDRFSKLFSFPKWHLAVPVYFILLAYVGGL